jgi:hypothetical protein
MDFVIFIAATIDRLDPAIGALLGHFRDEHVPIELSATIVAAAALLLIAVAFCSLAAILRIRGLRRLIDTCGAATEFAANFARVDERFSGSIFRDGWHEYREYLRPTESVVLSLRRPDEFLGIHTIDNRIFPARFFAAAHGYFTGIGLMLTFIGLVAALKFAATGIASPDPEAAKVALNALLGAAAFKFMTSIAGLGSSLILSIAARSASYVVETAASSLARDLERAMTPISSEGIAFDQLAATRTQLGRLELLQTELSAARSVAVAQAPVATFGDQSQAALEKICAAFFTEIRGTAKSEINQLTGKLGDVSNAIGAMQNHVGRSGEQFAAQIDLAATRLLAAATKLQETVEIRADQAGDRLAAKVDAMANAFARGETLFSGAADKAAGTFLKGAGEFDASLRAQITSMREIAAMLDRTRDTLKDSAVAWTQCTAPVVASVDASRQITNELGQIAGQVGAAQRDMAEMAKAFGQVSERIGATWDNYRNRFEKIDGELEAVFERLQGGTRAFGEEVMNFVAKLDTSLANGMQAFSLGTEELREVAQMFVINGNAKAA